MSNLPFKSVLQSLIADLPNDLNIDLNSVWAAIVLLQTSAQLMKRYEHFFERYDLSSGRFTVLLVLYQSLEPTLTPTECAERAGVSRGTVSGLLNRLDRQGLIVRTLHPEDGRMISIQLSEAGSQLMKEVLPEYLKWAATLIARLDLAEKDSLRELMVKL